MESIILLLKNAFIGAIGGLVTRLIDVAKGKTVSGMQAVAKVFSGGFLAHVSTPIIAEYIGTTDQGFVSAILGILGYKLIEFLVSGEFLDGVKKIILTFVTK